MLCKTPSIFWWNLTGNLLRIRALLNGWVETARPIPPGVARHLEPFSVHSIMRSFSLLVYATLVVAQQDPIQDICRRHQHQTCVIDDRLYIDGGKMYYGASVENGSIPQQIKSLQLSESTLLIDRHTINVGE